MSQDTERRVLAVMSEILGLKKEVIGLDAPIVEELGASSVDRVALMLAMEDEFGESTPLEDIPDLRTARQIVAWIENRLAAS